MTTAKDLLDEASAKLHGYGTTADRITPLSANIGPTDTTFTVDFAFGQAVGVTPGVVEIDSELLYVTSVDSASGICTVANGFGRGYQNTTATSHTAGARVVSRPKFPRVWLFKKINEIIGSLYPQLYAVQRWTTTVTYPTNTYQLPTTAGTPINVLDVQWQHPIGDWIRVAGWDVDSYNATLRLGSGAMIGRPLRVEFAVEPTQFTSESDNFTVTGLPATCSDVLVYGIVAAAVPTLDISRAQLSSVEQSDRSRVVPPNVGLNLGRYYETKFADRVKNEAAALRRQYKPRVRRTF